MAQVYSIKFNEAIKHVGTSETSSIISRMIDIDEESNALTADGFDLAIIGIIDRYSNSLPHPVFAYSMSKMVDILIDRDGMTYEEAMEYLEFNVWDSWMGEGTPIFVNDFDMY